MDQVIRKTTLLQSLQDKGSLQTQTGYKSNCSFPFVLLAVRKLNVPSSVLRAKIGCRETNWKVICKKVDTKAQFKLIVMKCVIYSEMHTSTRNME